MVSYTIKKPIWNTESVGIASKRVQTEEVMEITISYEDGDGQRVYPHRYLMSMAKIRKYPTQEVKGTKLYIVPIEDFHAVERGA